ncbi:MAG TPA: hypothetical protein VNW92_13425 [Polyangiaceae bacterium]|jgi:hypothetical protein|nr:hypothetical protein [Polyangiaceae bacterium]
MPPVVFVRSVKRAWHRDLASRPDTHAWVLNLYRAGERHPQTVLDYFPLEHAPSPELAEKMRRHRADEVRHTLMYERAIGELGQGIEEHSGLDVFNNAIRAATPASFAIGLDTPLDERARRLAHFLAHAYFLESRIAQSLEYHLEACVASGAKRVTAVVETVYLDEQRHTSYTAEAVRELVGARDAVAVLALHRRAEARANRTFSARQVRGFLRRFPEVGRARDRLLYAAGALLMQGGLPGV